MDNHNPQEAPPVERAREDEAEVRIGLLYSLTGSLSLTETSICHGAELAVAEVNAAGGIGGRPLVATIRDYQSDTTIAAKQAASLLRDERVHACIGGYTSASRVAMLPAFRRFGGLFMYTTYYEGLETDERTVYTGAVPNQFLDNYIEWIFSTLGRRVYVIGSDYIYPRTLGVIIQSLARSLGADVVAERYVPLGATDFTAHVAELADLQPDVIICNLVGSDSVGAFYRRFNSSGYTAETLPIAATVTTEIEVQAMGTEYARGHYMTATYFGSLDNAANRRYVAAFQERFGTRAVTHVPQVGAYNAVHLFALAAARARDLTPTALREALIGVSFEGNPEGWPMTIFPNQHADHPSYIGRTRDDGQFDVVAAFPPRDPAPYHSSIVPDPRRHAASAAGRHRSRWIA